LRINAPVTRPSLLLRLRDAADDVAWTAVAINLDELRSWDRFRRLLS
jgi:hypothetical protein